MKHDIRTLFLTLDKYNFDRYSGPKDYVDPASGVSISSHYEIYYKCRSIFRFYIDKNTGVYSINSAGHSYIIKNMNDIIGCLEDILNYLPTYSDLKDALDNSIMDLYIS